MPIPINIFKGAPLLALFESIVGLVFLVLFVLLVFIDAGLTFLYSKEKKSKFVEERIRVTIAVFFGFGVLFLIASMGIGFEKQNLVLSILTRVVLYTTVLLFLMSWVSYLLKKSRKIRKRLNIVGCIFLIIFYLLFIFSGIWVTGNHGSAVIATVILIVFVSICIFLGKKKK